MVLLSGDNWTLSTINEWADGDWRYTIGPMSWLPTLWLQRNHVIFVWMCLGFQWIKWTDLK